MNKTIPIAILANLLLLAACGRAPDDTAANEPAGKDSGAIAPALIPPGEVADPAAPPSYEVAIASAAADRNQALDRCAAQPEQVRTQCDLEANAAFADIEAGLQDLRGNQQ